MKKLLVMLAILLPMFVAAKKSPIVKIMKKYAEKEEFTNINIAGNLFKLAYKFGAKDEETKKILSQVTGISILIKNDDADNGKFNFIKELESEGFFKNNAYTSLLEVKEKNQTVRLLGKEEKSGTLSDLLLVIDGKENVLVNIRGKIDPENMEKLLGFVNVSNP